MYLCNPQPDTCTHCTFTHSMFRKLNFWIKTVSNACFLTFQNYCLLKWEKGLHVMSIRGKHPAHLFNSLTQPRLQFPQHNLTNAQNIISLTMILLKKYSFHLKEKTVSLSLINRCPTQYGCPIRLRKRYGVARN